MDIEVCFRGCRFEVVRKAVSATEQALPAREWIRHPGAVTILPLLDGDRICLILNKRAAVGMTLVELPAGTREPGESSEATAERELREETGFVAGRLRRIHAFYTSPGIMDERMELFEATDLTPGAQALDEGEQIETTVVPLATALEMALDGRIQDAKTMVGLLVYDGLRAREARPE